MSTSATQAEYPVVLELGASLQEVVNHCIAYHDLIGVTYLTQHSAPRGAYSRLKRNCPITGGDHQAARDAAEIISYLSHLCNPSRFGQGFNLIMKDFTHSEIIDHMCRTLGELHAHGQEHFALYLRCFEELSYGLGAYAPLTPRIVTIRGANVRSTENLIRLLGGWHLSAEVTQNLPPSVTNMAESIHTINPVILVKPTRKLKLGTSGQWL